MTIVRAARAMTIVRAARAMTSMRAARAMTFARDRLELRMAGFEINRRGTLLGTGL